MSEGQDNPGVVIFPPYLFAICVVAGVIAHFAFYDHWAIGWPVRSIGIVLAIAGLAIVSWGKRVMQAAGTNVNPNMPSTAIVAGGPFAFTRNPLYLSLVLIFIGIGITLASPAFLAVVIPLAIVLDVGVIRREERYLEAKFGEAYLAYKARVRRWV